MKMNLQINNKNLFLTKQDYFEENKDVTIWQILI